MTYADGKMLAEITDGVGLITFNQPEKRNAMSIGMWTGLTDILADFADDPAVRVVVLTGAGDKAFVSGADISQFGEHRSNAQAQEHYNNVTSIGRDKLAAFAKPVIAQIHGFCLGGGLGIAMQADIRIAAEDSQFGIPAAKLGIAYGFDMVGKLVSLVGPAHAKFLLYSGERIDGAEAARIGLVNRTVPSHELVDTVRKMALGMARNAPLSLRAAKLAVAVAAEHDDHRDMQQVADAVAACFDSADYREGRTAFMEKRKPVFTGA
jgi:enoyl-CoA hydratase/carnithine racemase